MQNITVQHKQTSKNWINVENLLKIDSLNLTHTPTIPIIDSRYDFMKDMNGIGSVSMCFMINDFGIGQSNPFVFLIGTAVDGINQRDGWSIILNKTSDPNYKSITFTVGRASGGNYPYQVSFTAGQAFLTTNKLYHLVLVKNGTTINAYLNGILMTSNTVISSTTNTVVSNNPIYIGGVHTDGAYANKGIISTAFLSIYNKVLSQIEVSQLYDQIGIIPKSLHANCVGYWTMQERYGNKIYDLVEQFNYAKVVSNITNGDFSSGSSGWSQGLAGGWTFTGGVATTPGNTLGAIWTAFTPLPNTQYKVTYTIASSNGESIFVQIGNDTGAAIGAIRTTVGTYTEILTTGNSPVGSFLLFKTGFTTSGASGTTSTIDNISIQAVLPTPNHVELIGYSDIELNGISIKPDFYYKQLSTKLGLTGGSGKSVDFPNTATAKYSGKTDVLFYFDLVSVSGSGNFVLAPGYNGANMAVRCGTHIICVNGINTNSSDINYVLLNAADDSVATMIPNKRNKFLIHYRAGQKLEAYLNGVKLSRNVRVGTDTLATTLYTGNFTYAMTSTSTLILMNILSAYTGGQHYGGSLYEFCSIDSSTLTDQQKIDLTTIDFPSYNILTSQNRIQHIIPSNSVDTTVYDLTSSPINGTKVGFIDINNNNIDIKSGLPELKKTVNLQSQAITFDTAAAKTIGTGNWSLVIGVYIPPTATDSTTIFTLYKSGSYQLIISRAKVTLLAPDGTHYLHNVFSYTSAANAIPFTTGFHIICFQKVGIRDFRVYDNGIMLPFYDTQIGLRNQPYPATWADVDLSTLQVMGTDLANANLIFVGLTTENLEPKKQLSLFNNSLLSNPNNLSGYKFFYQFNQYNSGFIDLVSNSVKATASYTATQLNPELLDYVITDIDRLRVSPMMYTKIMTLNMKAYGTVISKISSGGAWDNGGSTFDRCVYSGDATLEINIDRISISGFNVIRMVGFSSSMIPTGSIDDFNYAIYQYDNTIYARIVGTSTSVTTVIVGDIIKLKIEGTACKMYKNDVLIYTFATAVSGIQYVKTSFYSANTPFYSVKLYGTDIRPFNDEYLGDAADTSYFVLEDNSMIGI